METFNPKHILIVKNRALGDSIMGLSTLQYVREKFPNAIISYAIPEWTISLYQNVEIAADEIIPIKLTGLSTWFSFWSLLSNKKIDFIFELHLSGRTYKFFKVFSLLKKIPYFFHNHHLKTKTLIHDQGINKPLIQRDLDGLYSIFKGVLPSYLNFPPKMNLKKNVEKKNQILFGVVATRSTKMWPLQNYIELSKLIKENNKDIEILVPLSNSPVDLTIEEELGKLDLDKNLTIVHEPLENLPAIFAASSFYIGNDTGLKHLAIAMGIKTYTFFGPEPPLEWHPYDEKAHPYFYITPLECRTRDAHYCGLNECDSMICLKQITPQEVSNLIL